MDASFSRHGWSHTVGTEDMLKCSCVGNPLQRGDGVGVGVLLVARPTLVLPTNPSADQVLQLPKHIWDPLYHAMSHQETTTAAVNRIQINLRFIAGNFYAKAKKTKNGGNHQ